MSLKPKGQISGWPLLGVSVLAGCGASGEGGPTVGKMLLTGGGPQCPGPGGPMSKTSIARPLRSSKAAARHPGFLRRTGWQLRRPSAARSPSDEVRPRMRRPAATGRPWSRWASRPARSWAPADRRPLNVPVHIVVKDGSSGTIANRSSRTGVRSRPASSRRPSRRRGRHHRSGGRCQQLRDRGRPRRRGLRGRAADARVRAPQAHRPLNGAGRRALLSGLSGCGEDLVDPALVQVDHLGIRQPSIVHDARPGAGQVLQLADHQPADRVVAAGFGHATR